MHRPPSTGRQVPVTAAAAARDSSSAPTESGLQVVAGERFVEHLAGVDRVFGDLDASHGAVGRKLSACRV